MWGSEPPVPQRLVESWHELRSTQGRICPPRRAGSIHTVLWPPSLQDRLQTQLTTLKLEMDEAKAQGTQMGVENGALAGVLLQWVGREEARRWLDMQIAQVHLPRKPGTSSRGLDAGMH